MPMIKLGGRNRIRISKVKVSPNKPEEIYYLPHALKSSVITRLLCGLRLVFR